MIDLKITVATPNDVWGMQDVFYQTWLATYPNAEFSVTREDIEERFKDRYSTELLASRRARTANPPEGETTLVVRIDGKLVGVCRVTTQAEQHRLNLMYVLPEHQRQGVGTALWGKAVQCIDTSKPTLVRVLTYNEQAIRFYEGLGFVKVGPCPSFELKKGLAIPQLEMRREP